MRNTTPQSENKLSLGPCLGDGPFLRPSGSWQQNVGLWLLILPQFFFSVFLEGGERIFYVLAVALGAFLATALPRLKRANKQAGLRGFQNYLLNEFGRDVSSLDWFINAWFAGLMSKASSSPWPFEGLLLGFLCGLFSKKFIRKTFLNLPGIAAFLACASVFIISSPKWFAPPFSNWPFNFQWASISWPEAAILGAAFIVYKKKGEKTFFSFIIPWLASALGIFFNYFLNNFTSLQAGSAHNFIYSSRAALMLMIAALIAPRFIKSKTLFWGLNFAFLCLLIKMQIPQAGHFFLNFDMAPFLALLMLFILFLMREKEEFGESVKPKTSTFKAMINCNHQKTVDVLAQWEGLPSCRLATQHDDGNLLCPYACLMLGDCVRACPFGALQFKDNFIHIEKKRCRGCGRCEEICPKGLISLSYGNVKAFIACAAASPLKHNAEYCRYSCLGCGRCAKNCPAGAISRQGNIGAMEVEQDICLSYDEDCQNICAEVCPKQIIRPYFK